MKLFRTRHPVDPGTLGPPALPVALIALPTAEAPDARRLFQALRSWWPETGAKAVLAHHGETLTLQIASSLIGGCVPSAVRTSSSFVTAPICAKMVLNSKPTGAVRVWSGTMSKILLSRQSVADNACATTSAT